jgi:hypothetical protein
MNMHPIDARRYGADMENLTRDAPVVWVVSGHRLPPPTPLAHCWLPGDVYCVQHGEWCGAWSDDLTCCCDDTHRRVPPHPVS